MFSVTSSSSSRPSTDLLSSLAALASAGLVSAGGPATVKGKKSNQQQSDHLICEVTQCSEHFSSPVSHSRCIFSSPVSFSPGLRREGGQAQLLRRSGLPELSGLLQAISSIQVSLKKIMSNVKFTNIPSDCSYVNKCKSCCHLCNRNVRLFFYSWINNTYSIFCFLSYYLLDGISA